uniref:Uncharacterized protein n=1 Tax=Rhizophora mucronata TaxID=61149 RepID=A0A2P2QS97_RHIMU
MKGRSSSHPFSGKIPEASSETVSQSFLTMDLVCSCWMHARRIDLREDWVEEERRGQI